MIPPPEEPSTFDGLEKLNWKKNKCNSWPKHRNDVPSIARCQNIDAMHCRSLRRTRLCHLWHQYIADNSHTQFAWNDSTTQWHSLEQLNTCTVRYVHCYCAKSLCNLCSSQEFHPANGTQNLHVHSQESQWFTRFVNNTLSGWLCHLSMILGNTQNKTQCIPGNH